MIQTLFAYKNIGILVLLFSIFFISDFLFLLFADAMLKQSYIL